ncbi:MAG: DnaD domain protein [Anaerolineales bacterium]|nr:DnaD domain protein [Anaerolineales bacterium]
MGSFHGFTPTGQPVQIPQDFFTEILPKIDDLHTLKIMLLAFQSRSADENQVSYFSPEQMCLTHFTEHPQEFKTGLEQAITNQWLLKTEIPGHGGQLVQICFLNTPSAVAAIEAINKGEFHFPDEPFDQPGVPRPDIFRLYEENIGPLTPIISDSLKDLEKNYPYEWINQAVQTAVKNNARSLRYIEVVLQNWAKEGTNDRTDRRRRKKTEEEFDPEGYRDGDFFDN